MSVKDTKEFHLTTSKELLAIRDRVRNLVDHWGEDGRYKEAILKTVISRFLPTKYSIATGFVVRQTATRGEHEPSKQIDLIVYDNSFPTLFKEGDFVIVTPDSVKAIIEVKANLENQKSNEIIKKATDTGKFISEGKKSIWEPENKSILDEDASKKIEIKYKFFNGIFSFEGFESTNSENLEKYIISENDSYKNDPNFDHFCVNHICFNKDIFYKYWQDELYVFSNEKKCYLYKLKDLAISYFISNLMDYLSGSIMSNSKLWYPDDKNNLILEMFDPFNS